MTYLAAALFFSLAFVAAAVALHLTVRLYWRDILLALRGELGLVTPARPAPRARAMQQHAAF
ncbi:MAG TPA: hypothetical protein VGB59_07095 [Allosphingosinicella sp.]